ncbi:MAG: glycosyltransferase family 2 protein [Alphaproteobacteria bacterium]|nr:glycosyltransferase family 2 protein [Alphaproteobacteria bacterium]
MGRFLDNVTATDVLPVAGAETRSREKSWASKGLAIYVMVVYACVMALALLHLPPQRLDTPTSIFFVSIGLLALWRYSWWGLHVIRAVRYRKTVFPGLRHAADAVAKSARPEHVYVLITSYRVAPATTFKVYDALVKNAVDYGQPTTIIASITDQTDVDVLGHVLAENEHPGNIRIRFMFQKGDGKRSAMADVLRFIARDMPSRDSVIVFMDGDIQLETGALSRSIPFFFAERDLAALTTNNRGIVSGDDWTKEWYDLRYAQRDLLMSSMSLSSRLLVLTGRFSIFRADLATNPSFIDIVGCDRLDHWSFGRFSFLSGDDKSTWFWLLKHGHRTLYIPDVFADGFEELPDRDRFVASTVSLMRRWYGNMLRNNGRAIALGPRPMGPFTWWCLVDQRVSMWTSLVGPGVVTLLSIAHQWFFLAGYLFWIMMVRLAVSLVLGIYRRRFSPLWPPLLYYNQVVGAFIKTYVSCRLNQQTWVRQNITAGEPSDKRLARRQRRVSSFLYGVQAVAFVTLLAFYTKVLPIPAASSFALIIGDVVLANDVAAAPVRGESRADGRR